MFCVGLPFELACDAVIVSPKRILAGAVTVAALLALFMIVDIQDLAKVLEKASAKAIAFSVILIVASIALGFLRFASVLQTMHFKPPWRELVLAFSVGQVSSLFVLSVVGQSLTRALVLGRAGVPYGATISATYIERLLAAGILLVLSFAGLGYLFQRIVIDLSRGAAYFATSLAVMVIVAVTVSITLFGYGRLIQFLFSGAKELLRIWAGAVLTIAAHLAMLGAYVVILTDLGYSGFFLETAAALTIVMFTASLPISFAGWGVRELSAATALSAIGCPAAIAIAASVIIGVLTVGLITAISALGVLVSKRWWGQSPPIQSPPVGQDRRVQWDSVLLNACALFCISFVFFQVRLPVGASGQLTLNIADLGAITGLGMVMLLVGTRRLAMPIPRSLVLVLGIVSALFALGLVTAYFYGWLGNWALVNRGFGWIVILGYVLTMAAFVSSGGHRAWLLAWRAFVTAGMIVCIVDLTLFAYSNLVKPLSVDILPFPFEGFAGNQNAFVLQLSAVFLGLIILLQEDRVLTRRLALVCVALLTAVFFYTKSRTGLIYLSLIAVILSTLPMIEGFQRLKTMLRTMVLVMVATMIVVVSLPYVIAAAEVGWQRISAKVSGQPMPPITFSSALSSLTRSDRLGTRLVHVNSESERIQTIKEGLEMWRQLPILGAGLGGYVEQRAALGQSFNVIHSTPVWILAEMGAVGLVLSAVAFFIVLRDTRLMFGDPLSRNRAVCLCWLLLFTVVGSLVHDFFFQRVFWLLLGLSYAVAVVPKSEGPIVR